MPDMTAKGTSTPTGSVKSADRVLAILEYLASVGTSSFSHVARDLGLPPSSTHELLNTAVARGFVEYDDATRNYMLGSRLWEVAQAYSPAEDLASIAKPLMDRLVEKTRETVQLARLHGLDNVYLAISESPHVMKLVSSVGSRLPAHATGVGKVLLAGLESDDLDARLADAELEAFTTKTITSVSALKREIDEARRRGFGEDNEEYVVGCRCIAMPIRDRRGEVIAAMSVSVPTPRFTPSLAATIRTELSRCIGLLEQRIVHGTGH